jgi:hypothetical protein
MCCWEGSGLKLPVDSPFDPTDSSSLRTEGRVQQANLLLGTMGGLLLGSEVSCLWDRCLACSARGLGVLTTRARSLSADMCIGTVGDTSMASTAAGASAVGSLLIDGCTAVLPAAALLTSAMVQDPTVTPLSSSGADSDRYRRCLALALHSYYKVTAKGGSLASQSHM